MRLRLRPLIIAVAASLVALVGIVVGYSLVTAKPVPVAKGLAAFVHTRPPVPVVFTSRSEPASFVAPAPEAEGFTYPGTIPWAAAEGRLRLLDPDGRVYELTWGRPLPDGGTLVDVMSPSITLDGKRILFAGRRAAPDPGRWRIYEIGVDGGGLRQVTGGADDPGCVAVPPMRYAADGTTLSADERKRIDYDDVDPIDQGFAVVYASSRMPDLGPDHSRRATQIWLWPNGGPKPRPLSANRNNDRWPYLTFAEQLIVFSLWSRNREAVTEDGAEIRPVGAGGTYATGPTDLWVGARVRPPGEQFGYAVKIPEPVWRPRPLFNGKLAFMTAHPSGGGRLRLAQADWGYLRVAPSSLAAGGRLPNQSGGDLLYGPDQDADGRELSAGCPTACPEDRVLFAATPLGGSPGGCGIYIASDNWSSPVSPQSVFDDPQLVDADPVAVYRRNVEVTAPDPPMVTPGPAHPKAIRLHDGSTYDGPIGQFHNSIVNAEMYDGFPGQQTDTGEKPVIPFPTGIKSVVFYSGQRDRFDDPVVPRVRGGWDKQVVAPLDALGHLRAWVPARPGTVSVLAGLGADGKVFKWSSGAKDSAGRTATLYAVAGDHYSGARADGYHFCLGCHTGHTFIPENIAERLK